GLKDLDVFVPPSFDNEQVADHHNLETHFIDSSGLISWDLFKQDADFEFADWDFRGTSQEEFEHLIGIFHELEQPVYIADYEHLGVYACRILVPGMSDIYPAEDLLLANNNMGANLREVILALPSLDWDAEQYMALFDQLDEEGHDERTRVRELLGIAAAKGTALHTLRVGELKAMLALAAGELETALDLIDWTMEFNQSVFTAERASYYRALRACVELFLDEERDPEQYRAVFTRMYGEETLAQAWANATGEARFHGLEAADLSLSQFPLHQKLLAAYEKLQKAKRAHHWA
ncbi:MAG: YcaO-like family protein, partial [Aeromonas veronii]